MALISDTEKNADIDMVQTDCGETVTYKARNEGLTSFDADTGTLTEAWTETSLTAVRGRYSAEEVLRSEGRLEMGDVYFYIQACDLSAEPKQTDEITDGSETLQVFAWDWAADELMYKVSARRLD